MVAGLSLVWEERSISRNGTPESNWLNGILFKLKRSIRNLALSKIRSTLFSRISRGLKRSMAQAICDVYQGKDKAHRTIVAIFQEHNDEVESLLGKDFSAGTAERYRTRKKRVTGFIKKKHNNNDILAQYVDRKFTTSFEYYLKTKAH
jgi:hypothetical protein